MRNNSRWIIISPFILGFFGGCATRQNSRSQQIFLTKKGATDADPKISAVAAAAAAMITMSIFDHLLEGIKKDHDFLVSFSG